MNDALHISFDWLASAQGDAAERHTLAELCIMAGDNIATELIDIHARSTRKTARLSAWRLACWLAANWWRLRWEPKTATDGRGRAPCSWRQSHHVAAAGGGYLWPDLAFASDGGHICLHSRPTAAQSGQPIRYLNAFEHHISAASFESAVDGFVESVLARLSGVNVADDRLGHLWREIGRERADENIACHRKLEAVMGFDAGEASAELMAQIFAHAKRQGRSATTEVAAAAAGDAPRILAGLQDLQENAAAVRIRDIAGLRRQIGRAKGHAPWQIAEHAAQLARKSWGLDSGVLPNSSLSGLLGISEAIIRGDGRDEGAPMPAGWETAKEDEIVVILQKKWGSSRRFALARILGDWLLAGAARERLLPVTNAGTERQKMQRAFAQEFLCPFADLEDLRGQTQPTDAFIEDAAEHFAVSPLLVRNKLHSRGVLANDSLPSGI